MDNYIVRNTPAVVENVFTGLLWRGRNATDTIHKAVNHTREYGYCDAGLFRASINAALRSALESEKTFRAFIDKRRAVTVQPATKNAADYVRIVWEVQDDLKTVYAYLRRNIMVGGGGKSCAN